MKLDDHPTVKWYREQEKTQHSLQEAPKLERQRLRDICIEAGADDAGFIDINRSCVADQREGLLDALPGAKTLAYMVYRLSRENLRAPAHSIANLEFQQGWKEANRKNRAVAVRLRTLGFRALNIPVGFPMEMDRWPEKPWLTVDKINAVEAGLGRMGWNRLVLHPKFGSGVILGTTLTDVDLDSYDKPVAYNPCIECKLCVSVCPVGAIDPDGYFDFVSCYTHNYRERMGGFANWVETIVASHSVEDYRRKVSDSETVSMWQNLSMGGQTRCDRCMAICPAGEEAVGEYLDNRKGYIAELLTKMRNRAETVYVVPGSDAEAHVTAHFKHKTIKRVSNGVRPRSAAMFLRSLPLVFQRGRSEGLDSTFHFSFTGDEDCQGTVTIQNKTIGVQDGLVGKADLHVIADSQMWVRFLAKEVGLLRALITGKIRIKGSPKLMKAFAKCFPS